LTDINDYPSGTIIETDQQLPEEQREWFVRLPDHLIPRAFRDDTRVIWRSLADGQLWRLAPDQSHDIVAWPNARVPAPTPAESGTCP
jgi:hypothetical protein